MKNVIKNSLSLGFFVFWLIVCEVIDGVLEDSMVVI